jgi:hypothetical protein
LRRPSGQFIWLSDWILREIPSRLLLFRRAFHRPVRTENAAIAIFRGDFLAAFGAGVPYEAIIDWHDFFFLKPAKMAF